jgi:hypothetical protein
LPKLTDLPLRSRNIIPSSRFEHSTISLWEDGMIAETLKTKPHVRFPGEVGRARRHPSLVNASVHIWLDNLDFLDAHVGHRDEPVVEVGNIVRAAASDERGNRRRIATVSIRGQVPESDSFWYFQSYERFRFRILAQRDAADDTCTNPAIRQLLELLEHEPGPSTLILVSGPGRDAPAALRDIAQTSAWRIETVTVGEAPSRALVELSHLARTIFPDASIMPSVRVYGLQEPSNASWCR